jgi:hypothetical protein
MRYRKMVEIIQNRWKVILAIIFLVILIWMGYVWFGRWTGFSESISPAVLPNQTFQPAKTLWDWMQLLIIPAILAGGAYWLNESARNQEIKIASDNRQETALQTYLDNMTELLLDKKLRESEVDEVRAVARARTLTVLRRLDGERKGALIRFLYEADLIDKDKTVIDLGNADLSGANLSGATLIGANLRGANLRGANLSWAILIEANLLYANLSGTLYNKNTIWPEGFDPVAARAVLFGDTKKAWWQFWKK